MRDPGEWEYSCELGDFTSPSGRVGAVGMLGDARPTFRPLSTVRAVLFCWVTWTQGDGGGTGFFRSQVRAGSPMSPTLFEQVYSLMVHQACTKQRGCLGERWGAGQRSSSGNHSIPPTPYPLCARHCS